MDGQQSRVSQSLQYKLSLWISVLIAVISIIGGFASFHSASQDAYEFQDDQLEQIAHFISTHNTVTLPLTDTPSSVKTDVKSAMQDDAYITVQSLSSTQNTSNNNDITLPHDLPDGLNTWRAPNAEDWRVFVFSLPDQQKMAVAQRTAIRDELSFDNGFRTILPLLVLLPCLILVIIGVIRHAFKPITLLTKELDQKTDANLNALNVTLAPTEIKPFIVSINNLLSRLTQSIEQQRRFIADAAHELRSPVTALMLQAENVQKTDLSGESRHRLSALQQGLQRTKALLEQLLSLARHQLHSDARAEHIELSQLVHEVMIEHYPLAEHKHIDIGIEREEKIMLQASVFELKTLISNAIENAIRYTPPQGTVNVRFFSVNQCAVFEVQDNGIGIPENELSRVFDPFYRVMGTGEAGSGLGLSIIQKIAQNLGGTVELQSSPAGTLFRYTQNANR